VFVLGGIVLLALAVYVESRAKQPIIPLGLFRSRTVSLTIVASVLVGLATFGGTVFLSQYFQISLGKSPTVAGLMSLPLIFGLLVSSTIAGQLITKYGRWKPYLVAGAVVMTGGMVLLSTIAAHTSVLMLSIYMAVLGVGVGMLMQNLVLAAQNDVPAAEFGAATSTLMFFRSMGGAIGVSALGAVLASRVTSLLAEKFGPAATGSGAAKVPDLSQLPPQVVHGVREVLRPGHRGSVPGRRADRPARRDRRALHQGEGPAHAERRRAACAGGGGCGRTAALGMGIAVGRPAGDGPGRHPIE
jgi:MFS family permease